MSETGDVLGLEMYEEAINRHSTDGPADEEVTYHDAPVSYEESSIPKREAKRGQ